MDDTTIDSTLQSAFMADARRIEDTANDLRKAIRDGDLAEIARLARRIAWRAHLIANAATALAPS